MPVLSLSLYPLKTSQDLFFSNVFMGIERTSVIKLIKVNNDDVWWCPTLFCWISEIIHSSSLLHMKITASVTKSSHQVRGPCYLHLPIFFSHVHSPPLLLGNKKLLWSLFSAAYQTTYHSLFSDYYEAILVWGLDSIWLTNATYCL